MSTHSKNISGPWWFWNHRRRWREKSNT